MKIDTKRVEAILKNRGMVARQLYYQGIKETEYKKAMKSKEADMTFIEKLAKALAINPYDVLDIEEPVKAMMELNRTLNEKLELIMDLNNHLNAWIEVFSSISDERTLKVANAAAKRVMRGVLKDIEQRQKMERERIKMELLAEIPT